MKSKTTKKKKRPYVRKATEEKQPYIEIKENLVEGLEITPKPTTDTTKHYIIESLKLHSPKEQNAIVLDVVTEVMLWRSAEYLALCEQQKDAAKNSDDIFSIGATTQAAVKSRLENKNG